MLTYTISIVKITNCSPHYHCSCSGSQVKQSSEQKTFSFNNPLTSGLITSITFVVLYSRGDSNVVKLQKKNLIIYPVCLLFFYPLVPIALTIAYLVTKNEKHHERATISKFFAGFLDHGPQFVLRLVVVVLIGLSQGGVYQR